MPGVVASLFDAEELPLDELVPSDFTVDSSFGGGGGGGVRGSGKGVDLGFSNSCEGEYD